MCASFSVSMPSRRQKQKKIKLKIKPSPRNNKKLQAIFTKPNNTTKTIHFGEAGASDYPTHKDPARKKAYLSRHRKRENWNNPMTAGALSRWILWDNKSRTKAIKNFKKKFNLG